MNNQESLATPPPLSRRTFVRQVGGGSLVVGFNELSGSWITETSDIRGVAFERLRLDGTLWLDEATRREYAQDYGQIIHEQPLAVLLPGSVEDITRIVQFARRAGLQIAARGHGHLPFGQAQVAGGVVIDMRSLHTVHAFWADRMDVDAGASWLMVVQTALTRGLTPPVLPAYLGLSVGGTLSIGGVGPTTFRQGAQVDHVLELQVVTGEGEVVACSETMNRDLFEAVLAGQGQCGIMTRVVMRLVPASTQVREYVLQYPDAPTLLQDGARLIQDGRFDSLMGFITPAAETWGYSLVATRHSTPADVPDDAVHVDGLRHIPGSERAKTVGYLQHVDAIPRIEFGPSRPDLAISIPGSAAASFIGEMLTRLTPEDLGTASAIRVSFWKRAPFARPLLRIPAEDTSVYVVIQRTETTDPDVIARMLRGNRTLFERNREIGGMLYPFSALELSPRDWERHYGPRWAALADAKRRYDPDQVFASGPNLFRTHRPSSS
jgi:cytokinin dehydrogenase